MFFASFRGVVRWVGDGAAATFYSIADDRILPA